MKKKIAIIKQYIAKRIPKLQQILDRFPLRLNFFLLVIFSLLGYYYIKGRQLAIGSYDDNLQLMETSSFVAVFAVLMKLLLVFTLVFLTCSLLSTLLPFFLFSHRARTQKDFFTAGFSSSSNENGGETKTSAHVHVARLSFPLLGSLKLRFYYDEGFRTPVYSFPSRGFSFLFANKTELSCRLHLHNVRSYIANSVAVHFEDMLHLFSFSHKYCVNSQFYTLPQKKEVENILSTPVLAKETNLRTEVVRRVEGELLHFKDFEPSDDIRRIVWKVYAKNKELVVRVPELRNPYASEVSFMASYYNSLLWKLPELDKFLNHYKHTIWSLYTQLSENKDISLKMLSDQEVNVKLANDVSDVQQLISASMWQNDTPLSKVNKTGSIAILCLSSLSDIDDVEKQLGYFRSSTVVVLCCFSELFDIKNPGSYIRMLFMKPQEDEDDKPMWRLSPIRLKLTKNEEKLKMLLKQSEATTYILNV